MTVRGCTKLSTLCQPDHSCDSQDHSIRSPGWRRGRPEEEEAICRRFDDFFDLPSTATDRMNLDVARALEELRHLREQPVLPPKPQPVRAPSTRLIPERKSPRKSVFKWKGWFLGLAGLLIASVMGYYFFTTPQRLAPQTPPPELLPRVQKTEPPVSVITRKRPLSRTLGGLMTLRFPAGSYRLQLPVCCCWLPRVYVLEIGVGD